MHISEKTSEGLASIIVAYRTFGLFKDEAKEAMSELLLRKDHDNFDYEGFISNQIGNLPKSSIPNEVITLMKTISSQGTHDGFRSK